MVGHVLALLLWLHQPGLWMEAGQAAYYNEGVMEQVVEIRQAGWAAGALPDPLPADVVGFAARLDCSEIGDWLWICGPVGCQGPFIVADCANRVNGDAQRMERKGIIVEVDYYTAQAWDVLGRGPDGIEVVVIGRSNDHEPKE
jgi:hypothetical protein